MNTNNIFICVNLFSLSHVEKLVFLFLTSKDQTKFTNIYYCLTTSALDQLHWRRAAAAASKRYVQCMPLSLGHQSHTVQCTVPLYLEKHVLWRSAATVACQCTVPLYTVGCLLWRAKVGALRGSTVLCLVVCLHYSLLLLACYCCTHHYPYTSLEGTNTQYTATELLDNQLVILGL